MTRDALTRPAENASGSIKDAGEISEDGEELAMASREKRLSW